MTQKSGSDIPLRCILTPYLPEDPVEGGQQSPL